MVYMFYKFEKESLTCVWAQPSWSMQLDSPGHPSQGLGCVGGWGLKPAPKWRNRDEQGHMGWKGWGGQSSGWAGRNEGLIPVSKGNGENSTGISLGMKNIFLPQAWTQIHSLHTHGHTQDPNISPHIQNRERTHPDPSKQISKSTHLPPARFI